MQIAGWCILVAVHQYKQYTQYSSTHQRVGGLDILLRQLDVLQRQVGARPCRRLCLPLLAAGGSRHPKGWIHRLPRLTNQQDAVGSLQQPRVEREGRGLPRLELWAWYALPIHPSTHQAS